MILENIGIVSDQAFGGQEAIDKFIENRQKTCCDRRYQIILMDLNMPIVDGFQATMRILSYQKTQIERRMKKFGLDGGNQAISAVVAAVTAFVNDETLSQCLTVGMVDVFAKPVSAKGMENFVTKYYKRY